MFKNDVYKLSFSKIKSDQIVSYFFIGTTNKTVSDQGYIQSEQ